MLKSYQWVGWVVAPKIESAPVRFWPLLAPFGPIRVGTGLDWVWIGSGGIGDSGVGDLGLTIVLKLKLRLLSVYI